MHESEADIYLSVNSIEEILNGDDWDQSPEGWKSDLSDRVEEITDRKRSSVQGREKALATFVHILRSRYAEEEIRGKETGLVTSFLKSIKAETSELETAMAMKGMSVLRTLSKIMFLT